jgi:regulator of protease activity HflC (stomatin/prohibitin superfamily)
MRFILDREKQEAERKRIEAEGISDFQRKVAEGLTDSYLKWKGIEATQKLSESGNSKVVIIGSGPQGLPVILGGQ